VNLGGDVVESILISSCQIPMRLLLEERIDSSGAEQECMPVSSCFCDVLTILELYSLSN